MVTSSCRPDLPWSRSLEPYRASWRSGSNPCCPDLNPSSPRSELNDLLPHLGRTELAVILGASAGWQGGEGPGHQALLGRAAGQARGSGFERRHSNDPPSRPLSAQFFFFAIDLVFARARLINGGARTHCRGLAPRPGQVAPHDLVPRRLAKWRSLRVWPLAPFAQDEAVNR